MWRSVSWLVFSLLCFPVMAAERPRCSGEGEKLRPNRTVSELIEDLTSDYWPRVWTAGLRLESRQAEAIPALIELIKDRRRVNLRETWDLIYPGGKTFYGHGFIVDYDLDSISIRAGWVLENLTFENFGFSEGVINHDSLLRATIAGKADVPLEDVTGPMKHLDSQRELSNLASQRAEIWWRQRGTKWTRRQAIIEALTSQDPVRISRTMDWLRNGTTRCDGFDRQFVKSKVLSVSGKKTDSEMQEFGRWIRDMEKEDKDITFYRFKNEDACY
jgi:hypothetical protein